MVRLALSLIIAFSMTAIAKYSVGVDLNFQSGSNKNNTSSTSTQTNGSNSFSAVPYIGIYYGESWELCPFLGWVFSQSSISRDYSNASSSNSSSSTTRNSFEIGGRLFYRVLQKDIFDLSIGPELGYQIDLEPKYSNGSSDTASSNYSKYYSGTFWLGCPLNIDLHFNTLFSVRLSATIGAVNYYSSSIQTKGSSMANDQSGFSFNFKTIFQPTMGFYLTF
jgi:hypothetical protein